MTDVRFDYDVVIAGGGMVGTSLALLLDYYGHQKLKVLVVESFALGAVNTGKKPVYSPSFDARSTALSYGSRLILEPLGLWPVLEQHLAEIQSIHVCDKGYFGSTLMHAKDIGWPALGYVIENSWLGNVLLATVQEKNNLDFFPGASVKTIHPRLHGVELTIDCDGNEKKITAQLAVVADGANSSLRAQLGISTQEHDYRSMALVANVSFRNGHQHCAYERFTDQGPLALLPLPDSVQGEHRSGLVWSLPGKQAQQLSECSAEEFLAHLQKVFGGRLGEFTRVGDRFSYPLKLVQSSEQVRSGIVLIGNAAHSLHPVAGQGFNLALRDCARLVSLLVDAHGNSKNLGDLSVLQQYVEKQRFDQRKTIGFSDQLPALFNRRQWPLGMMRGIGLCVLDILPGVKSQFMHHAAGVHDGVTLSS